LKHIPSQSTDSRRFPPPQSNLSPTPHSSSIKLAQDSFTTTCAQVPCINHPPSVHS
jgi:hypothetical protein